MKKLKIYIKLYGIRPENLVYTHQLGLNALGVDEDSTRKIITDTYIVQRFLVVLCMFVVEKQASVCGLEILLRNATEPIHSF